jgi:CRISPR-associated endoribonuclease Cas6
MPARITVHLAPASGRAPVPPAHTGPGVNAAFLAALRDAGEDDLAKALHGAGSPKPYALTPLVDERNRRAEASSAKVRFEIGVLADPLTGPILQALAATSVMRVARCVYQIAAVELIGAEPYPELLADARPGDRWGMDIRTPVAFFTAREEGARRVRVFPEPEWVFADLHRRWRAFASEPASEPAALDEAVGEAVTGHLEVTDHRLSMAEHLVKAGAPPGRGSVGEVAYRVVDAHRLGPATLASLDALMRFSAYAGIGDRTAVGMGYVLPSFGPPQPEGPPR